MDQRTNDVLFVSVTWDENYAGARVAGTTGYYRTPEAKRHGSGEDRLFVSDSKTGYYKAGIGRGLIRSPNLDVVFVARKAVKQYVAVAIYFDVGCNYVGDGFAFAFSRNVKCLRGTERTSVPWPGGRQLRRWARGGKTNHEGLLEAYEVLAAAYGPGGKAEAAPPPSTKATSKLLGKLGDAEKKRIHAMVRRAIRDQSIRPAVLAEWGSRCALCQLSIEHDQFAECEIAHIKEVNEDGGDTGNVFPLCRTHHWAFDRHLWSVKPSDRRVFVRKSMRAHPSFKSYHGETLKPAHGDAVRDLGLANLKFRWKLFVKAGGTS